MGYTQSDPTVTTITAGQTATVTMGGQADVYRDSNNAGWGLGPGQSNPCNWENPGTYTSWTDNGGAFTITVSGGTPAPTPAPPEAPTLAGIEGELQQMAAAEQTAVAADNSTVAADEAKLSQDTATRDADQAALDRISKAQTDLAN